MTTACVLLHLCLFSLGYGMSISRRLHFLLPNAWDVLGAAVMQAFGSK